MTGHGRSKNGVAPLVYVWPYTPFSSSQDVDHDLDVHVKMRLALLRRHDILSKMNTRHMVESII